MKKERRKVLSFLFDDSFSVAERKSVAETVQSLFDCTDEYVIIPKIIESFDKKDEIPSLSYFQQEYNYDYEFELEKVEKRADVLEYIDQDLLRTIERKLLDDTSEYLDNEKSDPRRLIHTVKNRISYYESKLPSKEQEGFEELYRKRKESGGGIKTYIDCVDELTGTLDYGSTTTIAGETGEYKSSTALHIMRRNMIENGKNFVFISFEMSQPIILYKILSAFTFHPKWKDSEHYGIGMKRFKEADLTPEEEDWVNNEVRRDLRENPNYGQFKIITADDIDYWTTSNLRSEFARLDWKPDSVIVDYVQLFSDYDIPKEHGRFNFPGNYLVRQMLPLTDDVDGTGKRSHLILLSQVNEQGYEKAEESGGKYPLQALLKTKSLKQNSSYIIFTWFPPHLKDSNQIKYYLGKNRWGEVMSEPRQVSCYPEKGWIGQTYQQQEKPDKPDEDELDKILG